MLDFKKIDLKQEIAELEKIEGKERGQDIKYLIKYVQQKEGEEGKKKLEAELARLGYALPDVSKLGLLEWIPASLPTIYMLASAKFFGWQEKDIFEMGANVTSFSVILRCFIRYFVSFKKTTEKAAANWKNIYSWGELKLVEFNKKKKELTLRLYNFKKHPITCIYIQGAIHRMAQLSTGSKQVAIKEIKCMFKGDPYHEFKVTW